ncbi:MAG: PQQ-binding-like beta-propeller repeat protein [Planctomycetes bacterium]|nr:PQQ-binding-like beta-propeller repeat protein [Planctomycetota bacterium]
MLRPIVVTVTAFIFLPVASSWQPSSGADVHWPGWRGPARDGWVNGFQPPTRWPERLERVWQVQVGAGYASPVVSGDRVYQHARQGDDEVVWCLDLETGTVKWHRSYALPFTMGRGGERHGKGPKSSPALAGPTANVVK